MFRTNELSLTIPELKRELANLKELRNQYKSLELILVTDSFETVEHKKRINKINKRNTEFYNKHIDIIESELKRKAAYA